MHELVLARAPCSSKGAVATYLQRKTERIFCGFSNLNVKRRNKRSKDTEDVWQPSARPFILLTASRPQRSERLISFCCHQ